VIIAERRVRSLSVVTWGKSGCSRDRTGSACTRASPPPGNRLRAQTEPVDHQIQNPAVAMPFGRRSVGVLLHAGHGSDALHIRSLSEESTASESPACLAASHDARHRVDVSLRRLSQVPVNGEGAMIHPPTVGVEARASLRRATVSGTEAKP